jgi:hypothetical protein
MTGKTIQSILAATFAETFNPRPDLREAIIKGVALGFVKETEYDRWIYED